MSTTRIVRNKDNNHLLPLGGPGVVIGFVDEVNGPGAAEIPDFVPTRHELLELVKYWETERLVIMWSWGMYGLTGSSETRVEPYGRRRIARIEELLGGEEVRKASDEALLLYREERERWWKTTGSRLLPEYSFEQIWNMFVEGDSEQMRVASEKLMSRAFLREDRLNNN